MHSGEWNMTENMSLWSQRILVLARATSLATTSTKTQRPASSSSSVVARPTETTSQPSKNVRAAVVELQGILMEPRLG
ncbi:hypothetical protein V5799_010556 [Amblyomma americanum]|uniref:Uncharacterized protein n=1 Tax=Amblyomma americanum TaxID=6943 RepID=A0AAQ4EJV4_AMBAM